MSNPMFSLHSNRSDLGDTLGKLLPLVLRFTPDAKFVVNGVAMTGATFVERIQKMVASMTATDDAHRQLTVATVAEEENRAALRDEADAYRAYVLSVFGASSKEYAALGFQPKKRSEPDLQTRAAAADKLRATRAARHTMGKKQRAAIHGVVAPVPATPSPVPVAATPVVSVVPVTTVAASAPPPAPAASNPSALPMSSPKAA